jgi:hypothetical protein
MANGATLVAGDQPGLSVYDQIFGPSTPQDGSGTPRADTVGDPGSQVGTAVSSVLEAMFNAGKTQAVSILGQTKAGQDLQRTALQAKLQSLLGSPLTILLIIGALLFFGSRLGR